MQAIRTTFYGPNNRRGARVGASCEAGKLTVGYDHGLSMADNHMAACLALMAKFNWRHSPMVGGDYKGDTYWVFMHSMSPVARLDGESP